ncbi:membrane protein [Borreliella chilensis]|uniref:Membrane protein n=1 Tax=Borreliella chilensis TaxID=1245910 RepID=A0A0A7UVB7_9SPIR|nr:membrane protein [Borreliella chilensis]
MKSIFTKLNISINLFLFIIFILAMLVILIFSYKIKYNENYQNYFLEIYNNNFILLINKFVIFVIGILGSLWAYINYKRTNNIQFILFYCFISSYTLEPILISEDFFLKNNLNSNYYLFTKFILFINAFSLLNLFFLSLYICDFKIKSIHYTIYIILTFACIYSYTMPINSYENSQDYSILKIESTKFYINAFLLLISTNFLVAFLRKKNFDYFFLFISMILIVSGIYLNLLKIPYSFLPISIGIPIYLKKSRKIFFHWL